MISKHIMAICSLGAFMAILSHYFYGFAFELSSTGEDAKKEVSLEERVTNLERGFIALLASSKQKAKGNKKIKKRQVK